MANCWSFPEGIYFDLVGVTPTDLSMSLKHPAVGLLNAVPSHLPKAGCQLKKGTPGAGFAGSMYEYIYIYIYIRR